MKDAMATATLTSKGQITIPMKVRRKLGLDAGDRVEFVELAPGEFALKAATEDVRSLKGIIRRPVSPVSIDAMNAAVKRRGASR
jgi:antitoxin PrlF